MAIHLNNKTKLTTDLEKTIIEIGGGDPNKTLTEDELRKILPNAIEIIGKKNPNILRKIYLQYIKGKEIKTEPSDNE